jgi:hypothetical protein
VAAGRGAQALLKPLGLTLRAFVITTGSPGTDPDTRACWLRQALPSFGVWRRGQPSGCGVSTALGGSWEEEGPVAGGLDVAPLQYVDEFVSELLLAPGAPIASAEDESDGDASGREVPYPSPADAPAVAVAVPSFLSVPSFSWTERLAPQVSRRRG